MAILFARTQGDDLLYNGTTHVKGDAPAKAAQLRLTFEILETRLLRDEFAVGECRVRQHRRG
jgi:hypothetical protein